MNNERHRPTKLYRNAGMTACHLSLVVLLSACGSGNGPVGAEEQNTATGSASVSAAQLSADGTTSLSVAQATGAGLVPVQSVESSTDTDITVAGGISAAQEVASVDTGATPDLGAAVAGVAVPTNTTDAVATSNAAPAQAIAVAETQTAEPLQEAQPEPTIVPAEPTDAFPEPTIAPEEQTDTEVEPTIAPAEEGGAAAQFTATNTDGFVGDVLDDGVVRVRWKADPTARGYNIYRQAEYVTTVFDAEYIDTDTFDESYYYEVQAFDFDENFNYIARGLTVEVTGTGRVNPDSPKPEENLLDGYELVFADEFNGTELDSSKWVTKYLWGDQIIINSEEQHYVDIMTQPDFGYNPFSFDGESVTITAVETPDELVEKAYGQEYLSGVFTSYESFRFTYGYVEARAKVPFGRGIWPAFWLLNAYYDIGGDKPEIDIMEFIGDDQDVVYHTYHYYDSEGNLRSSESTPSIGRDFTNGWHTYAVEWTPGSAVFYVDGIREHEIVDSKMSQEDMYIIANLALGGWWAGSPNRLTEFPASYQIDYIRAYQKAGGAALLSDPTEGQPSKLRLGDDVPNSSPSHLPPFDQWPEGYPER